MKKTVCNFDYHFKNINRSVNIRAPSSEFSHPDPDFSFEFLVLFLKNSLNLIFFEKINNLFIINSSSHLYKNDKKKFHFA